MTVTTTPPPLRAHQTDAVTSTVRELTPLPHTPMPPAGLRTQVIMATGSGKTLVAVHTADRVGGDRVLVLVPSLDLLDQTARAWRDGGRTGAFVGVSSLDAYETGFPHTTDPHALVQLTAHDRVTVFATYASLGNGILEVAHDAGLSPWGLIVVDEAHRTSGRTGKPWAVVHDNARIPAVARLYMTATPRIWTAGDGDEEDGELVASMTDDPEGLFGRVAYRLPLETAIELGIVAPYQVVVVDVQDHQLNAAMLAADEASDAVRGLRLGALQAATLKAAEEEGLRRVLSFHQRVSEAEAFAAGLPDKARDLHHPSGEPASTGEAAVWAQWLHGEHRPAHRRRVLTQFAAGLTDSGQDARLSLIASVKVLGEGVDTRECDGVVFCDVRGSMPDLVQAVGRALRMHPGEGKIATLVVPAFLSTGETPETMLTSPAYAGLAKLLAALRAHDTRIEHLASPGTPAPARPGEPGLASASQDDAPDDEQATESVSARSLLRFSQPRDAHQLASFVQLRVLNPERVQWRRGIQAAQRYRAQHDDLRVPYGFRTPEDWAPAGFPLGVWIADCRRHYKADALDGERIVQLEKLGMLWSLFDARFDEGLTAAAAWATESGVGLAAPVDAEHGGYPVGRWLKNQRAAARRAKTPLSPDRRTALEEIDPDWCPEWTIDWQRAFRLAQRHVGAGGTLPPGPGILVVDGEDLGRWAAVQCQGFGKLTGEQQALLGTLGIKQAAAPAKRTREEMWAHNLRAAAQYRVRVGNLDVPRSHTEEVDGEPVRLGAWISQQRVKAGKLSVQRVEELSALDMRWS
ncbi:MULTISPECIES: DEAD/DEAH box helicase [unclassified Streptomyces]|uniref:DEAD/DEAH box helicase n=1 Tax=unclassified Streptomyces TaxID=2593676 RepID=UPI001BE583BE|nr:MULTISPECIES: helicase associated domain-containing protein [unclassified Streptomyces]MBT2406852.1 Helicase associated domain protein [Streptomyces sp. ISL-21]MBT2612971.1 Helicase associated domain protein [Streptomyces sp. ISL-87]